MKTLYNLLFGFLFEVSKALYYGSFVLSGMCVVVSFLWGWHWLYAWVLSSVILIPLTGFVKNVLYHALESGKDGQ